MMAVSPSAAKRALRGTALAALPVLCSGCDPSPADLFPGPWVDGLTPGITRVLNNWNVTCENAAYRPSAASSGNLDPNGEFLVYCSEDGVTWTSWMVFPGLARPNDLVGPGGVRAGIPPP